MPAMHESTARCCTYLLTAPGLHDRCLSLTVASVPHYAEGLPSGLADHAEGLPSGLAVHAEGLAVHAEGLPSGLADHAEGLAVHAEGLPSGLADHAEGLAVRAEGLPGLAECLAVHAASLSAYLHHCKRKGKISTTLRHLKHTCTRNMKQ